MIKYTSYRLVLETENELRFTRVMYSKRPIRTFDEPHRMVTPEVNVSEPRR